MVVAGYPDTNLRGAVLSEAPEGETEDQRIVRESVKLPAELRARVDESIVALSGQVPGLTRAETAKLVATRDGRDALAAGRDALARVDNHLQSVTGERNPIVAKKYGVYGSNPVSFAGVHRALGLSAGENARIGALPEADPARRLRFSPLIEREVNRAFDTLTNLINARLGTRAALSRAVNAKGATIDEADRVITAVRNHLYANLPNRKQDEDLREYGFAPITPGGRPARDEVEGEEEEEDVGGPTPV